MSQTVVVVTFYSRSGVTERLATAAAVGAVQARAGIRMRRLADVDPAATIARHPESREALVRMHTEYVGPREADVLAADALVVGLPPDVGPSAPECAAFFDLLATLGAGGRLAGKAAAAVGTGSAHEAVTRALAGAGLVVVRPGEPPAPDEIESAKALGRQLVTVAQSLKRAPA